MKQQEDMKNGYDEQLADAKKLKTYEVFMSKPKMPMSLYLTKDIWEEYNLMSCELNVPFKSIVFPGIKDYDSKDYVLCASSLSCYKLYHLLFENYLVQNHPFTYRHTHHPEMVSLSSSLYNCNFKQADKDLMKKVRFTVRRNYAGIPMGPGMNKDKRKLVMDIVEDLSRGFMGPLEGKFYKLDGLSEEDK